MYLCLWKVVWRYAASVFVRPAGGGVGVGVRHFILSVAGELSAGYSVGRSKAAPMHPKQFTVQVAQPYVDC